MVFFCVTKMRTEIEKGKMFDNIYVTNEDWISWWGFELAHHATQIISQKFNLRSHHIVRDPIRLKPNPKQKWTFFNYNTSFVSFVFYLVCVPSVQCPWYWKFEYIWQIESLTLITGISKTKLKRKRHFAIFILYTCVMCMCIRRRNTPTGRKKKWERKEK